jgi:hypothetical protein
MTKLKQNIFTPNLSMIIIVLILIVVVSCEEEQALSEAIDSTLSFLSGSGNPSNNTYCVQNIKELMIRNGIQPSINYIRNNITDAQILRLGVLASIALISPWNQDTQGKFTITDRGVLVEEYHPSSSESDIMLCVVCTLLAIIVLFHVTSAQHQYVISPQSPQVKSEK